MAKQRVINTRFWVDPWVQEQLNSMDRLLFLYLLTNDQTNLSGIYEISNHKMCFETGIEKETLLRAMFPRLEPKVYREGNWIIMVNFPRHQNVENPKISQGIQRELDLIPEDIYKKAIGYGYPIHRVSHLTKPNLTKLTDSADEPREVKEVSEEEKPKRESSAKYPNAKEIFSLWGKYPKAWESLKNVREREAAQNLYDERGLQAVKDALEWYEDAKKDKFCPRVNSPYDLDTKWERLDEYSEK